MNIESLGMFVHLYFNKRRTSRRASMQGIRGRLLALMLVVLSQPCFGGGWYVGNTAPGEWIQYDKSFLTSGTYRFTARAGTPSSQASFHLEVDGIAQPSVAVPITGRPDAFKLVHLATVPVASGTHDLRIVFESTGISLDWFMVVKDGDPTTSVKASDTVMVRPPTNGMLVAPVVAFHPTDFDGQGKSIINQFLTDSNNNPYTEAQLEAWFSVPMQRDYDRRTDRYWDNLVDELMESRAQVPLFHCRRALDFQSGLQDRSYASGASFEGRWLKKFAEAVGRNPQAAAALKIGMFWNGDMANGFYKQYGYYPGWGDPALADFAMLTELQPWFDNIPASMLHQPQPNRPIINLFSSGPANIVQDGKMSVFMANISARLQARYGYTPLYVIPNGGGSNAEALSSAWGVAPWVYWNGPVLMTGTFNGAIWGTIQPGSRHLLQEVWLNDWDPETNTGTAGGKQAGNDCHISRLDANDNSNLLGALNTAASSGSTQLVMQEGFNNIAEGNSIFRSYHPEWKFPNQHLAAMRQYADPVCQTMLYEAEGCDSYYKTSTAGNRGGAFRTQWYSDSNLDVYRPAHNLQSWVKRSTGPGNLAQISAGFYDVWALDGSGIVWTQPIDGNQDQWIQATPLPPCALSSLSVGKTAAWGIGTNGTVYSCRLYNPDPTNANGGWVVRTGVNLVQLHVGLTQVWGVDASNNIWCRAADASGGWTQVTAGTQMDKVWIGDLTAWAISGTNLYYCPIPNTPVQDAPTPLAWIQVPNPYNLTQLSVGSNEVWGINAAGAVYRMSVAADVGIWDPVPGAPALTNISVGENYAWGLSGTTPYSIKLEGFLTNTVPVQVVGVKATPGVGQVTLSWVPCPGAISYSVQRWTAGGTPAIIATPSHTNFDHFSSYVDADVANGTAYYYSIQATNSYGSSTASAQVSVTPIAPIAAPTGLSATSGSLNQVSLSWTNPASNASGFQVERSTTINGPFSQIAMLQGTGTTSLSDTVPVTGVPYFYRVRAFNSSNVGSAFVESAYSNVATGSTVPGGSTIYINFQPSNMTPIPGYWVDAGTVYAAHSVAPFTTANYGWNAASQTAQRGVNSNPLLDSVIYFHAGGTWKMALPNGTYEVLVSVGDRFAITETLNVQGVNYWNNYPLAANQFATMTKTVTVTTGTLTLDNGAGAEGQTRINYIQITPVSAPPVPVGVTASAGNTTASITWTPSQFATSYNLLRASTSGGPYTNIGTVSTGTAGVFGVPSYTFTDTGLANGATYYYVVQAVSGSGPSGNSAQVSAVPQNLNLATYEAENATLVGLLPYTSAPGYTGSGYAGFGGYSGNYIQWTVNTGAAATANLTFRYAGTRNAPLSLTVNGSLISGSVAFVSTGSSSTWSTVNVSGIALNAGTNSIRLTNIGYHGNSIDNMTVAFAGAQSPAMPTNITTAVEGSGKIVLNWTAVSGATSYLIQRSIASGGPYSQIATTSGTTYTDTGLTAGTNYYYTVLAANGTSYSPSSLETPGAAPLPTIPTAPTGLTPTAQNNAIALSWTGVSGAYGYNIYKSTTSGGPYTLANCVSGRSSCTMSNLVNGMPYYFVVAAVNAAGEGPQSTQISATPIGAPPAPTGLVAAAGNASAALSWNASYGATSYSIKRATVNGGPYSQVATATLTSATNTGLTNGTTYYYVVSAIGPNGESAVSAQASATPQAAPAAPTNLLGTSGSSQVTLSWTPTGTLATSYNVKRSLTSGSGYVTVANVTGTTCTNAGLTNGTLYYYVVSAVGIGGESTTTPPICMMPGNVPSPWMVQNIDTATGGGVHYSGTTFNVEATGREVGGGGAADQFLYVYQTASGDCSIQAKVTFVENTSSWTKHGVMIRETLAGGSVNAAVLITSSYGVVFQNRSTTAAATNSTSSTAGLTAPYWLKVTRVGNTFTGYRSPDGVTWTQMGNPVTVTMGSNVQIGFFGSSHVTNLWGGSTFTNVSATP